MAPSRDSQPGSSIYTPLDKATRSIRLLRFTEPPVGSAHNLHFTLTVHKLPTADKQRREDDSRAKFIALSYVWGPEKPERSVNVNGKRLKIRENLHALLQVLHKPTHVSNSSGLKASGSHVTFSRILRKCPYIWADAICIDQKAGEEKTHQVNMMGDIYLQAEWVVCWLGPAADDSNLAMDWIRNARDDSLYDPTLGPPDAMETLLDRPYWRRLWIVQEFALARRPLLLCGQSMVSLSGSRGETVIQTMIKFCSSLPAWAVLVSRGSEIDNREELDLRNFVVNFSEHECEKSHDRIFALLAICYHNKSIWNSEIPRITADYNVTPERLFYRVLADRSAQCYDSPHHDELQRALNLPHCEVETRDDAYEFVEDVLGPEGRQSLYEFTRHICEESTELGFSQEGYTSDQLKKHELIQITIIRECRVKEVTGHMERLTGLTREDMLKDPEGVYLEVLGRLFHYDKHEWHSIWLWVRGRFNYEHVPPGISGKYTSSWEVFTNILRRTLGMPLIDYAILRDTGTG